MGDYDAQTGKYTESDPIGLNGDVNTYSYVSSNPLSFFDPKALSTAVTNGLGDCVERSRRPEPGQRVRARSSSWTK
jgi:uncharacterized protein RhaS with RHS repeats